MRNRRARRKGARTPERAAERVRRVEERLLVLLHVGVVGEGQPLHHREEPDEVPVDPAGLAPDQLGHVRVLLLRHDRRPGGVGVREVDEAELGRRPQHELLGEPGQMGGRDRRRRAELEREVAIRHGVHAVRRRRPEAESLGERVAVDGDGGARERGRAERAHVEAAARVGQPLAVPGQHEHVRQEMVSEQHRLRPLEVGVARHRGGAMPLGLLDERRLHLAEGERGSRRSRPGARAACRARSGRFASGRCGASLPRRRSSRSGAARCSCGCPRARSGRGRRPSRAPAVPRRARGGSRPAPPPRGRRPWPGRGPRPRCPGGREARAGSRRAGTP